MAPSAAGARCWRWRSLLAWHGAAPAQGLAELYRAALAGNPNVQLRRYEIDRARAEADGVRSRLLPQVVAQGAISANRFSDTTATESYGSRRVSVSARQSLYEPATLRRHEAAQSITEQREQELAQTRLQLFGELLERYLQVLAADDMLATLNAETQAASQQVDRLKAMRERQMAKVTDLAEAQAYLRSLATRTIDAENDRAVALARLGELTGFEVTRVAPLAQTAFEPAPGTGPDWAGRAQRAHPRLLALERAVDSARRYLEANRAERLPQLAAAISQTYSDQGYDNRRQPPYHASSVGLEVRVPLYEGGRVDAGEREAVARLGYAEQQLDAARREVEREVLAFWWGARADRARIDSTDGEVLALEQAVTAQEKGLELGASRVTDLLDARRRLLKARADQAKARYDFLRDIAALQIRAGELADAEIGDWDRRFAPSGR